jgi:branched-chain amino acid transport system substrate-binding protein
MNNRWWIIGAIVLILLIVLVFHKQISPQTSGETIKIGGALGLSGSCASWGEGERKAYQMAIDDANSAGGIGGEQIELVAEDTACDVRGTVNATQKLIDVDKVALILGPTWGDSFQAGYTLSEKAKVVTISPSAAFESLFYNQIPIAYSFSTWFPEREDINALQTYAQQHNLKTAVLLHDQDPFGLMMVDLFSQIAPSHGLSTVKEFAFPSGFDDFRTTITQIKALHPDVIFAAFQGPLLKAKFLKQAHDLGLKTQLLSSTDIEDASLLSEYGDVMEGIIYAYPKVTGAYDAFGAAYKNKYGVEPEGPSAANAYDAALVAIAALKENAANGTDLKTAVEKINIPGTITETLNFSDKHQLGGQFEIKTIRNGEFVVVQ